MCVRCREGVVFILLQPNGREGGFPAADIWPSAPTHCGAHSSSIFPGEIKSCGDEVFGPCSDSSKLCAERQNPTLFFSFFRMRGATGLRPSPPVAPSTPPLSAHRTAYHIRLLIVAAVVVGMVVAASIAGFRSYWVSSDRDENGLRSQRPEQWSVSDCLSHVDRQAHLLPFPHYFATERDEREAHGSGHVCEGYWRDTEKTTGRHSQRADASEEEAVVPPLPWPKTHQHSFCGKREWMRMLTDIEAAALSADAPEAGLLPSDPLGISVVRYRGLSWSRVDNTMLGNVEFRDARSHVCWTQDFGRHYVEKHNVVPSETFYRYVIRKNAELRRQRPR